MRKNWGRWIFQPPVKMGCINPVWRIRWLSTPRKFWPTNFRFNDFLFCHSKSVVIFRIDKSRFSFLFSRFFDVFFFIQPKNTWEKRVIFFQLWSKIKSWMVGVFQSYLLRWKVGRFFGSSHTSKPKVFESLGLLLFFSRIPSRCRLYKHTTIRCIFLEMAYPRIRYPHFEEFVVSWNLILTHAWSKFYIRHAPCTV